MGPKEVVMRGDEGNEGDSAVHGLKSGGGTDVEFDRTVKPLDELFKTSEFSGDFVEILKADDLFKSDLMILVTFLVKEQKASDVGRVAVGDEGKFLIGIGGADGFVHGDGGGESLTIVGDVVRSDLVIFRRDKQEDKGVLTSDFDVCLVAGGFVVDRAFESHVELMAVVGSGFGVVEDGFVRDMDVEHDTHNVSRFTGT